MIHIRDQLQNLCSVIEYGLCLPFFNGHVFICPSQVLSKWQYRLTTLEMIMSECMTLAFAVDLLLATQYDIIYHE